MNEEHERAVAAARGLNAGHPAMAGVDVDSGYVADLLAAYDALAARLDQGALRQFVAGSPPEGAFRMDLHGCARCDGDGHDGIWFEVLRRPAGEFTHWAPCPETGEPILLKVTP